MTGDDREAEGAIDDADDEEWRVVESVAEYETGWYTGGYDLVAQPDGSEKRYYWAALPPAVVVVAIDRGSGEAGGDELVMVEQYRPTIREHCLELPAGIVEEDEDYETAGARELREETGFEPERVEFLESFWVATGVFRHERGFVVAEGLESVGRDLDDNEFLSVTRVPAADALDRARADPANDATIEGLLLAEADGYL
jgi:ADP-ribose pyrophosphatase